MPSLLLDYLGSHDAAIALVGLNLAPGSSFAGTVESRPSIMLEDGLFVQTYDNNGQMIGGAQPVDAPIFYQSLNVAVGSPTQVTVSANDVDGDILTYSASAAMHGTVSGGDDGMFTYTPEANYIGTDSFTVTVEDGQGGSRQQTVDLIIGNMPPSLKNNIQDFWVQEDQYINFIIPKNSFFDLNGDVLVYNVTLSDGSPLPPWLTFFNAKGQFFGSPPQNYNGSIAVKVSAFDGEFTASDTFVIQITPVNDAPVVANAIEDQFSTEVAAWSYQVPADTFSDVDGDTLTFSAAQYEGLPLPTWLSFDGSTRTFSGTPPQDFNGDINLTVTASDGHGGSASASFILSVEPTPVVVVSGEIYEARVGVADIFVVDASQDITATVFGFEEGDSIVFQNRASEDGAVFDQGLSDDGIATITAGNATIELTALVNDNFNDEQAFASIYGTNSITYVM